TDFVAPLALSTVSKNDVFHLLADQDTWSNHVELGRWADLFVMAPLTCNTLAKMANGLCDNMLMAVYLSSTAPIVVAPAMDEDMWKHPATQQNLQRIQSFGHQVIPVETGELASGLIGPGRMAEPEAIVDWIHSFFLIQSRLTGKQVLITAGPTYENIDPVRFIGNYSTGKMGYALAAVCTQMWAKVTLVSGPTAIEPPFVHRLIKVTTAEEMYESCIALFPANDLAILTAAVADYRPDVKADQKIKKQEGEWIVKLVPNPDILKQLGALKKDHQCLVGFALETENESENAQKKRQAKNADFIVMNSLRDANAGFGSDSNKITIFDKSGEVLSSPLLTKHTIASLIIDTIINKFYAQ
ncbi:MAG: bifunctional phosphopantothenoylcysteine decarboxylase/phosphopantothenate--cysteine ligase CoaBC, partial [Ferruginibacter sp.]